MGVRRLLHISEIDNSKILVKFSNDKDTKKFLELFKDRYFFEIGPISYFLSSKLGLYAISMLIHKY